MPTFLFGKPLVKKDYFAPLLHNFQKWADEALLEETAPPAPPALPDPPSQFSSLPQVYAGLSCSEADLPQLFPLDGNMGEPGDPLHNDCTAAAIAHAITVYAGLIGQKKIMFEADVLQLHQSIGGMSGDGYNVRDALVYWLANPISGDTILSCGGIQKQNNVTHIRQAIQLFGGVLVGFQVEQGTRDQFLRGQPWDGNAGPLLNEGHTVFAVGYDANYLTLLTWGTTQRGTWSWLENRGDEIYAVLPPEANDPRYCPGYTFDQLAAALVTVRS
jgi:hypothetical protein